MLAGGRLGPYEIVAPLGAGGMGEVYRARDTRLGREVAIKVLREGLAADPERVRRFEQEARAAASLNHANVVVLHDVGRHDGQPYLVTELLDGETLAERIHGEGLGVAQAVDFAVQIARGLAAAHARGIVHRDLKPSNVFVTKDGVVKLLDFGLARLIQAEVGAEELAAASTESGRTGTGTILGTVGYMAPEQVRGQPADQRADVFAFGCVLYEMLSGRRAFVGETPADTLSAILSKEPEPLSAGSHEIPGPLDAVVRRCLEKRAEDRFSSAHDVALALGALSVAATPVAAPHRRGARFLGWAGPHRTLVAGLAGALVLIAAAMVAIWWRGRPPRRTAVALEPRRVAVAIFENQTGDASLDPVGKMVADWVSEGLSRLNGVEIVPSSLVFELARERPAGAQARDSVLGLAAETGAGLVVSGAYYAPAGALRFQARITDAGSNTLIFAAEPATGSREDPLGAVESVRRQLVDSIAARYLDAQFATWAAQPKPPRYEAYAEFLAADAYYATDDRRTIAHYTRALELDPDFVLPRLGLTAVYVNAGDYDRAGTQLDIIEKSREALTPFHRSRLDYLRAVVAGRFEEALAAAREDARLAPGDVVATYTLGGAAIFVNRPREGVEVLSRPIHWELMLKPTQAMGSAYFWALTAALHFLGEHERELAEARRGRTIYPDLLNVRMCETRALVALGRLDEMEKAILESQMLPTKMRSPGGVMLDTAAELRVHGHRETSLRMAAKAAEWFRSRPGEEGASERTRSSVAECLYQEERWEEAAPLFAELAKAHPENLGYSARLGSLAARLGDRAGALRIAEELRRSDLPYPRGRPTYHRAAIAALLGEKEEAMALLRDALAQGVVMPALHTEMDLEPLYGYPPFEELIKPRG